MTKLISAFSKYARARYVLLPAILAHGTGMHIAVCMSVIKTLGSITIRRCGPKGASKHSSNIS